MGIGQKPKETKTMNRAGPSQQKEAKEEFLANFKLDFSLSGKKDNLAS